MSFFSLTGNRSSDSSNDPKKEDVAAPASAQSAVSTQSSSVPTGTGRSCGNPLCRKNHTEEELARIEQLLRGSSSNLTQKEKDSESFSKYIDTLTTVRENAVSAREVKDYPMGSWDLKVEDIPGFIMKVSTPMEYLGEKLSCDVALILDRENHYGMRAYAIVQDPKNPRRFLNATSGILARNILQQLEKPIYSWQTFLMSISSAMTEVREVRGTVTSVKDGKLVVGSEKEPSVVRMESGGSFPTGFKLTNPLTKEDHVIPADGDAKVRLTDDQFQRYHEFVKRLYLESCNRTAEKAYAGSSGSLVSLLAMLGGGAYSSS